MTATINPAVRHGGTFGLILRDDWLPTGHWPELDALAAAHAEAVEAYQAAVESAPKAPSIAEYDQACRAAMADGEPLPEPPPSPTPDDIQAGEVRVAVAKDRVLASATTIIEACAANADAWANGPAIRQPIATIEQRLAELREEIDQAERDKARLERLTMWLDKNRRHPWIDPTPDHYQPDSLYVAGSLDR